MGRNPGERAKDGQVEKERKKETVKGSRGKER